MDIRKFIIVSLFFNVLVLQFCNGQEGQGKYCIEAEPLCGSSYFSYANTSGLNFAETGPDYGCLGAQLNPSWFYFQIEQDGDIQLRIEQSTLVGGIPDLDVDFIVYGPFNDPRSPCIANLTSANIVDCSFETDLVEDVNIPNTLSGEYYLLLITNFSLAPGYITVTQTAGSATTNCILVEDPIVIERQACDNSIQTLDASTPNATYYHWYIDEGDGSFSKIIGEETAFLEVSEEGIYKAEALNALNVVIAHYQFNFSVLDASTLEMEAKVISNAFVEENDIEVTVLNDRDEMYEYSIDGGPWQSDPVFKNVSMGEHQIRVINATGCREGSVATTVMDYPLYFTPNGDGFNDTWHISGLKNQPQSKIQIFNRYGKLLKYLGPSNAGWDGTYNGENMPPDDYWFTVSYLEPQNGSPKLFKAHFTLKR